MATKPLSANEWAMKRLSNHSMRLLRKKAAARARTLAAMQAEQQIDTEIRDTEQQQRMLISEIAGETRTDRPLAGLDAAVAPAPATSRTEPAPADEPPRRLQVNRIDESGFLLHPKQLPTDEHGNEVTIEQARAEARLRFGG